MSINCLYWIWKQKKSKMKSSQEAAEACLNKEKTKLKSDAPSVDNTLKYFMYY